MTKLLREICWVHSKNFHERKQLSYIDISIFSACVVNLDVSVVLLVLEVNYTRLHSIIGNYRCQGVRRICKDLRSFLLLFIMQYNITR